MGYTTTSSSSGGRGGGERERERERGRERGGREGDLISTLGSFRSHFSLQLLDCLAVCGWLELHVGGHS